MTRTKSFEPSIPDSIAENPVNFCFQESDPPRARRKFFPIVNFLPFAGHTDYLRGCMADIIYNGARVIEYAKSRKGQSEATAVTWSCSPEFDATRSTEVSFVEDGAFTAIPRPIPRSGSKYVVKTPFHRVN